MFQVINTKTGKAVKNAINCKPFTFDSKEDAEYMAASMKRDSILNATAWNRVRPTVYEVRSV